MFLTGMIIMLCQNSWIREYTTVFGIHVISAVTLLATFTACLGIGNYIFGKVADLKVNKLFLFGLMQAVMGTFILLHPCLFSRIRNLYLYLNDSFELGPYSVMFIRATVSFFYFLLPVSLMGGILPVLGKHLISNMTQLGRHFSNLYGFYVTGLLSGIVLMGIILTRSIGIHQSLMIAAVLSLLMAMVSLLIFNREGKQEKIPRKINIRRSHHSDEFVTIAAGKWKKRLLRIFFITCFATLTYKLVWTRILLEYSADKTVYFITLLSGCFAGSLALGNFIVGRFADRIRKKFFVLAITEILIGITSMLSIGLFTKLSGMPGNAAAGGNSWGSLMALNTGIVLALYIIPFTLAGFVFPLVTRMYAEDLKTLGQKIGTLGVLDAAGAIAASFIVTFIFIPLLGTYKVFAGAAMVNTGIGIFILLRYRRIKNALRATLTITALLFFAGIAVVFSEKKIDTTGKDDSGGDIIETRHEGSTVNVEVHRTRRGHIVLYINGAQAVSSDPAELKGDKLLSCLPYLFKPDAERVCVIGLGIGITAKTMVDAGISEVDIVEISPEVTNVAADAYAYVNDNILAQENISITIEDGRSYLFRSKRPYDIIICNAAHPRLGIALYTGEYYRLCRDKLKPEGFLCQWLPAGWLSEQEFRSLIKTCTAVFPRVTLWYIAPGQTLLLASSIPQQLNYCQSQKLFEDINIQGTLTSSGIDNVDMILAGLLADDAALRAYTREAHLNTDVLPWIEFSRITTSDPDDNLVKQLSSFRIKYEDYIVFSGCPEVAGDVMNSLTGKNLGLRLELEYGGL